MGLLSLLQGWGQQQPMQPQGGMGVMPGEWDWMKQWGQGGYSLPGMVGPQQQQQAPLPDIVNRDAQDFGGPAQPIQPKGPGFMDRLNSTFNNPMFQKGLTLLGEGQNGGNWSRAMQRWGEMDQNQAQQANQRFQQQVQMRGMQRQEKNWGQEDQQRQRWEQAVQGEADPKRKQMLLAIGPDGYGQYLQGQTALEAEQQARLQQQEFTSRENALDRGSRFAVAGMGRDPLDTAVGRMAAARVGGMQEASLLAQQSALPRISRLRAALTELGQLNGVHNPVSSDGQRLIGRLTGGGGRANQLREEIKNLTTSMSLDMAEKLKPMSNSDIAMIQAIQANPDMTLAGAMAILDNQEAELKRGVQTAGEAARWFDEHRGLGPNSQGQSFEDYVAGKYPAPKSSQQSAPVKAPPKRGDVEQGYRFLGGDPTNPRNWVQVNGQRQGPPQRGYGTGNVYDRNR